MFGRLVTAVVERHALWWILEYVSFELSFVKNSHQKQEKV